MDEMSTQEAAKRLGVSQRQIQRLVASHALRGEWTAGRTLLVDALDVNARRHAAEQARGRPWSSDVSWGALWMLSGLEAAWLTATQRSRLHHRLGELSVEVILARCRKRVSTGRYRAAPSALVALQRELVLSGASAHEVLNFGLASSSSGVEGYCLERARLDHVKRLALIVDPRGAVILHVPSRADVIDGRREMPLAVIAADLAGSNEVREREAGLAAMRRLQADLR